MPTAMFDPSAQPRRTFRATITFLSLPLLLSASAVNTAFAQPAPVAPTPATPAPAAAPEPAATVPPAPAAEQPKQPPPAVVVSTPAPASAPSAQPAPQTKSADYDGPPLLLGDAKKKPAVGGYGGPTVAYTHMLNRDGVLIGGEGAVLVDHRLSFGGAGYAFSRSPDGPAAPDGTPREFFTGYGGFLIRYAVYSDIPVYASLGALIGGGALTLAPRQHDDEDTGDKVQTRGYFVAQPDVSLHVNATRWLRFGLVFGYRVATAVNDFDFKGSDMSGPVVGGNFQGGWF